MNLTALIIQLIAGALGGNAAGSVSKDGNSRADGQQHRWGNRWWPGWPGAERTVGFGWDGCRVRNGCRLNRLRIFDWRRERRPYSSRGWFFEGKAGQLVRPFCRAKEFGYTFDLALRSHYDPEGVQSME